MPLEEDIGIAYKRYFTHGADGQKRRRSLAFLHELLRWSVEYVIGLRREKRVVDARYLNDQAPGKLLEIGCGNGDYLARMKGLGWDVEGIEIDPVACRYARQTHRLLIHECSVERKNYCDDTFDAIVVNDVIEHVFDPISLLKECRRIVKQGGLTVVLTPNAEGNGHSVFGENWIGLDPPRHIFLFSPKTLEMTAHLAGFKNTKVTTTAVNAEFYFRGTLNIQKFGTHDMGAGNGVPNGGTLLWKSARNIKALLSQAAEFRRLESDPNIGEEVAMICSK
jgi:2-polyprenyl-3-methyl-5-hydroxy-6-metoxy-1,4-benzoquinol methylase